MIQTQSNFDAMLPRSTKLCLIQLSSDDIFVVSPWIFLTFFLDNCTIKIIFEFAQTLYYVYIEFQYEHLSLCLSILRCVCATYCTSKNHWHLHIAFSGVMKNIKCHNIWYLIRKTIVLLKLKKKTEVLLPSIRYLYMYTVYYKREIIPNK